MNIKVKNLPVYKDNPFINKLITEIKVKTRTTYAASKRLNIVDSNGIVDGSLVAGVRESYDKEEFIKIYSNSYKSLFELSSAAGLVFRYVLTMYCEQKYNNDIIFITHAEISDKGYMQSYVTFRKGLSELIDKSFLAQVDRPKEHYFVNPNMFYKGNRLTLIKEIIRKDELKGIENND